MSTEKKTDYSNILHGLRVGEETEDWNEDQTVKRTILRVPGGWIFESVYHATEGVGISSVFVPLYTYLPKGD